jgi:hypothetical protein
VAEVPDVWLTDAQPDELRRRYVDALLARLEARPQWLAALRGTVASGGRMRVTRRNRPAWLEGRA